MIHKHILVNSAVILIYHAEWKKGVFGMAKKPCENKYVLAAKDMNGFLSDLEEGLFHMPGMPEDYIALFRCVTLLLDNLKGLGKFIKKVGLSRNECGLYWESLLLDGFTLFATGPVKTEAQVIELCDGKNIKFLATARK